MKALVAVFKGAPWHWWLAVVSFLTVAIVVGVLTYSPAHTETKLVRNCSQMVDEECGER